MSFLGDLVLLLQHGPGSVPVLPPAGDAGIGGAAGGDSPGLFPGGGANAGGSPQNAPTGGSSTQGGGWQYWLNPFNLDPGPAFRQGEAAGQQASDALGIDGIWRQITAGAPIVGVYALLALLFLIGVVGLVLSSSPGQAAIGAATGEVGAAAAGVGRAAGRRITRRKAPPKPPPK